MESIDNIVNLQYYRKISSKNYHYHLSSLLHLMPVLHLQRNRHKSAMQKIYDARGNFNDGCVASGARLL